jgi:hypothetical protein
MWYGNVNVDSSIQGITAEEQDISRLVDTLAVNHLVILV